MESEGVSRGSGKKKIKDFIHHSAEQECCGLKQCLDISRKRFVSLHETRSTRSKRFEVKGAVGVFRLTALQDLDLKTDGLGTRGSRRWW